MRALAEIAVLLVVILIAVGLLVSAVRGDRSDEELDEAEAEAQAEAEARRRP